MHILPANSAALDEALKTLRAGGVVAHATETCYGLACDLADPAAVAKLFRVKRRPETQPVSALFPSVGDAKKYVEWNDRAEELATRHLPGPLTLILRIRPGQKIFPNPNPNPNPTLGVRVSPHPVALDLVTRFGSPVSTTSANVHGGPNPYSAEEVAAQFAAQDDRPDLILDSGALPPNPPSIVMDLTVSGEKILRS